MFFGIYNILVIYNNLAANDLAMQIRVVQSVCDIVPYIDVNSECQTKINVYILM